MLRESLGCPPGCSCAGRTGGWWRRWRRPSASHGNPLHNIPRDLALAPVVEAGGARIGVPGQALHVFERDALLQQVGDGGDAEGMGE